MDQQLVCIAITGSTRTEQVGFVELPAGLFHRTDVVIARDGKRVSAETRFVSARGMRL